MSEDMKAPVVLTQPLKWHGGKHYLAPKIVALMPKHTHYVEPFAGGLSVLLAKDFDGYSEVVNDTDQRLTNFWRILAEPANFEVFLRHVQAVPFSEVEWLEASSHCQCATMFPESNMPCIPCAVRFFIHCRQSLAGRMKSFAPLSKRRPRRGMNEQASAWLTAIDGLPLVHRRLIRIAVLNRDATHVIAGQDGRDTLFYLDPPYLESTRFSPNVYSVEATKHAPGDTKEERELANVEWHGALLDLIKGCSARVILSGYRSPLYDNMLATWTRHDFDLPNNAAGGDGKRRMTESVWCNF